MGNKSDQPDRRAVTADRAKDFASENHFSSYIETSAVGETANVTEAFLTLVRRAADTAAATHQPQQPPRPNSREAPV